MDDQEKILVLCLNKGSVDGHNKDVEWSESGSVECVKWDPDPASDCRDGLFGLAWGEGDSRFVPAFDDDKWLVLEVELSSVVYVNDLDNVVKFPHGVVVHCGTQQSATDYLIKHGAKGKKVVGATVVAGHGQTAQAGDRGTSVTGGNGESIAGDSGIVMSGRNGIATAGVSGVAMVGYTGTATAGNGGLASAANSGKAIVGNMGWATAGCEGNAIAGYWGRAVVWTGGTAIAGNEGRAIGEDFATAVVGDNGIAIAGHKGKVMAGEGGTIVLYTWGTKRKRYREVVVGYIGENGLKPNTFYRLNDQYEFEEVPDKE